MRATCAICRQERNHCKVVKLTEEEKDEFRKNDPDEEPPDELFYCQPCWKTISDPVSGPALMKGIFQAHLQSVGVPNAEELAKKFHTKLLQNTKRRS